MEFADKEPSSERSSAGAVEQRLWLNFHFNLFWLGQSLSDLGDAFAILAFPLLVLQATGSVAQMGLVTATFSVGRLLIGIFAGAIVDRYNRRILMIGCDLMRFLLFASIPMSWWLIGPQIWLLYVVAAFSSCFGTIFDVAYITAVPNLVERDQITEANSRLQTTSALAAILGLTLSGLVCAQYGATFAIGIDALSFAISALSLLLIRLRSIPATSSKDAVQTTRSKQALFNVRELLAGATFLWRQPVLRPVTIFLGCLTLLTTGAFDLFVFHLKHDLALSNATIGLIVGLASIGSIIGGLLTPFLRKRLGFGPCWIGGWSIHALGLALIAVTPNLVLCSIFTIMVTCSLTMAEISSISLRQQITPDAILGRVTSAFWMLHSAPAPLGAALFTAISVYTGTVPVLVFIGATGILTMLIALLTPARQRFPERVEVEDASE